MFDTQKSNQLRYPHTSLTPQQEKKETHMPLPTNLGVLLLPAHGHAHIVALLAWAVRTAEEHGILEVVEQTTAGPSFLAAVQTAKACLSSEEEPSAPISWESEKFLHAPWSTVTCEPRGLSPNRTRRQKVSFLRLGNLGDPQSIQLRLPTMRSQTYSPSSVETNRCQFEAKRWALQFAGKIVTQRNLKGWRYLSFLLQHPREEVHVLDLLQLTDAQPGPARVGLSGASADQLAAQGLRATRRLDECTSIDATARSAYRHRLEELQDELEEAERFNDPLRGANIRAEIEFLAAELATGYGYRTHSCTVSETAEKARKAVTNRIRDALTKIENVHPALWRHLLTSLKTGTYCSYQPAQPTRWVFES